MWEFNDQDIQKFKTLVGKGINPTRAKKLILQNKTNLISATGDVAQTPWKINLFDDIPTKSTPPTFWEWFSLIPRTIWTFWKNVLKGAETLGSDIHRIKTWRPEEAQGILWDIFNRETNRQQRVFEAQQRWTIAQDDKAFVASSVLNSWVQILWDAFMRWISSLATDKQKEDNKKTIANIYNEAMKIPGVKDKITQDVEAFKSLAAEEKALWAKEKEEDPKFAVIAEYIEELAEPILEIATAWWAKKWTKVLADIWKDVVWEVWEQVVKKADDIVTAGKKITLDLTEKADDLWKKIIKWKEEITTAAQKQFDDVVDLTKEIETGLTKEQVKWFKSNPYQIDEFTRMNKQMEWAEWLRDIKGYKANRVEQVSQDVRGTINKLDNELSESGKYYNDIRKSTVPVKMDNFLDSFDNILGKNWMKIDNWTITRVAWSKAWELNPADITKFNQIYWDIVADTAKWHLTPAEVLQFRKTMSNLAWFDQATTWKWQRVMRELRKILDIKAKNDIPWLRGLDKKYADKLMELKDATDDLVYRSWPKKGELRSNYESIISNINKPNRRPLLNRLEEATPGIGQRIEAIDNLWSLHRAMQNRGRLDKFTGVGWVLAWATAWWAIVPLFWHVIGAILWGAAWKLLEWALTWFRRKAIIKVLNNLSEEGLQNLKKINNKIKNKKLLTVKDKDILSNLRKQVKNEIPNTKSSSLSDNSANTKRVDNPSTNNNNKSKKLKTKKK